MEGRRDGGCQCGSVRYPREGETLGLAVCHSTLDDTYVLDPGEHYWTKRIQGWVPIPGGARCFEDDG